MKRHAFWLICLAILPPAVTVGAEANAPGGSKGLATQPTTPPAGKAGDGTEPTRPHE